MAQLQKKNLVKGVIKKAGDIVYKAFVTTSLVAITGVHLINYQPAQLTQDDYNKNVEMLDIDNYFTIHQVNMKLLLNKDVSAKYTPSRIPKDATSIDVYVKNHFSDTENQAINDALEEYNSIFEAIGVNFRFNRCEDKFKMIKGYNIVISKDTFNKKNAVAQFKSNIRLFNGQTVYNTLKISSEVNLDYYMLRKVVMHELMHYFGAGDLYYWNSDIDADITVMGTCEDFMKTATFIGADDIKYLFAMYDKIENQQQIDEINKYIEYHHNNYNIPKVMKDKYYSSTNANNKANSSYSPELNDQEDMEK